LAFEGDGVVTTHVGGYTDYINYKNKTRTDSQPQSARELAAPLQRSFPSEQREAKKFTNKHKHELEKLPQKIENLTVKIAELSEELSNTEDRSSANLAHISMEIANLQKVTVCYC
jgi:predicted  nucleic acid-binding Zn-ribbon protein